MPNLVPRKQVIHLATLLSAVIVIASVPAQGAVGQSPVSPAVVTWAEAPSADTGESRVHTLLATQEDLKSAGLAASPAVLLSVVGLRPPAMTPATRTAVTARMLPRAPDYRWEGLLIGAVALGAAGVYVGAHFCQLSDSADKHCVRSAVRLGFLGALGGGIIGGLIGGSIPKSRPDSGR